MGNSIVRGKKRAKVMKISGETIKFKTPVNASEVARDHPGLVVVDSEAVKHYGVRAQPLEPHHELDPNRLYFLVELPPNVVSREARRVRSAINMSAKDRLERLMLARRSSSDLSIVNPNYVSSDARVSEEKRIIRRVKVRVRKGDVERVMRESKDEGEAAEKIMNLYIQANNGGCSVDLGHGPHEEEEEAQHQLHGETSHGGQRDGFNSKKPEKRVSFLASTGGATSAMEVAVAS